MLLSIIIVLIISVYYYIIVLYLTTCNIQLFGLHFSVTRVYNASIARMHCSDDCLSVCLAVRPERYEPLK